MSTLIIIDFVVSFIVGIIAYISTNNWILGLCVLFISLLYFSTIFNMKIKRYKHKVTRYHECYNFINTFIVSLSVTNSIIQAFERTTLRISKDLQDELSGIENLAIGEKINYLKRYFPFHVYELFLNVLHLFEEQGGDILKMSSYLLKEARLIEEYIDSCWTSAMKRLVEVIGLWALSFAILLFIRFGLSQFFEAISKQLFFPISIGAFFAYFLICVDISIKRLFDVEIRGFKGYEKVKRTN